jgi:hypothetical protein
MILGISTISSPSVKESSVKVSGFYCISFSGYFTQKIKCHEIALLDWQGTGLDLPVLLHRKILM